MCVLFLFLSLFFNMSIITADININSSLEKVGLIPDGKYIDTLTLD